MTVPRDQVRCRQCGTLLGYFNRQHDKLTLEPGVAQVLELRSMGFGITCPSCGEYRMIRAGRAFRIGDEPPV